MPFFGRGNKKAGEQDEKFTAEGDEKAEGGDKEATGASNLKKSATASASSSASSAVSKSSSAASVAAAANGPGGTGLATTAVAATAATVLPGKKGQETDNDNGNGSESDDEQAGQGTPNPETSDGDLPPDVYHQRRSSVNGQALVSDLIAPPDINASLLPAPAFLKGNVLKLFNLKAEAILRVQSIISGPGGLQQLFGFQPGEKGGAACATEALVADLCGGGGAFLPLDLQIADLHEKAFENYNRWSGMVGAELVYSVQSDPDKKALIEDRLRFVAEHTAIARNCGLPPKAPGASAVSVEIGSVIGSSADGSLLLAGGELASSHSSTGSALTGTTGASKSSGSTSTSKTSGPAAGAAGGAGGAVLTIGGINIPIGDATAVEEADQAAPENKSDADADASPIPRLDSTGGSRDEGEDGIVSQPKPEESVTTGAGSHKTGKSTASGKSGSSGTSGASSSNSNSSSSSSVSKKSKRHHHRRHHGKSGEEGEGEDDEEGEEDGDEAENGVINDLGEPAPLLQSTQPGSDPHTRLVDLCLYYCIRAESADLKFMPELLCWLFHQMRHLVGPQPSPEEIHAEDETNPESSFFARSTVLPLYNHLKKAAKKEIEVSTGLGHVICCCRKLGRKHTIKNSVRPNYDDFNEWFWRPDCLNYTWHSSTNAGLLNPNAATSMEDAAGLESSNGIPQKQMPGILSFPPIVKTFREKSSYLSIILSFWRLFAFFVILFHALSIVAQDIVKAGGVNLAGIVNVNIIDALLDLTGCFVSLAFLNLAHALIAAQHALPFGDHQFWRHVFPLITFWSFVKGVWALAWAGVLAALYWSKEILGTDLFGGPIWLIVIGIRLACIAIDEGIFSPCGCSRANPIRRFFMQVERVYLVTPEPRHNRHKIQAARHSSGDGLMIKRPPPMSDSVLGWRLMRQPFSRSWKYTLFWLVLLAIKIVFDLQILTQQQNLVDTVQAAQLSYNLDGFELLGIKHPIVVIGSWMMIGGMYALDSYIVWVLGASVLGWWTLKKDGVGRVRHNGDIKVAFLRGLPSSGGPCCTSGHRRPEEKAIAGSLYRKEGSVGCCAGGLCGCGSSRVPLAERFVSKVIPLARVRGVDANSVFRRSWDQFIMSLREEDLIGNDEQCRLLYGDAVLGITSHLPLFLYAGKLKAVIRRAPRIAQMAYTSQTDDDFIASAVPDEATEEAAAEVLLALPHLLTLVCQSHSAIGYNDPHVAKTIAALFQPRPDQSLRELIGAFLTGQSPFAEEQQQQQNNPAFYSSKPINSVLMLRQLAGMVANLTVEFEKEGASTRLRGSPLLDLTCKLLLRVYRLWHPYLTDEQVEAAISGSVPTNVQQRGGRGSAATGDFGPGFQPSGPSDGYAPSFMGPMLERLASMAAHSQSASAAATQARALTKRRGQVNGGSPAAGDNTVPEEGKEDGQEEEDNGDAPQEEEGGADAAESAHVHGRRSSVVAGSMPPGVRSFLPAHVREGSDFSSLGLADTRSVIGIIRLLKHHPNELSGRLDAEGEPRIRERYLALREAARRCFYLLTMDHSDGSLRVPEAERRVNFFVNSLFMEQMPTSPSVLEMPSFAVVTPHYSEPIIYGKKEFLSLANRNGVSPMLYLKSLHSHEWENFCERLGVKNESEAWKADKDAQNNPISGEMEVRLWASNRGQTLARTVAGVMEYARAIRLLATMQLEIEYLALEDAKAAAASAAATPYVRTRQEVIERDAALAAQYFTSERFGYVLAAQKYSDHGEEDIRRRADLDYLLYLHPLLSVAYFEASVSPYTAKKRLLSVMKKGRNDKYRIPLPGNPIADGIGEGKPENQNNGINYAFARVLQTLDMNQSHFFEECLKLPNALRVLSIKPTTGKPVVLAGMREHIYTSCLSSSAFFMSQQELLFGTMFQRLMASPLRTRFHYGHPDLWDSVFIKTRGSTAKAASVLNVSEDIFGGYNAAVRGGDNEHILFMQVGKGRDVGVLQIETFESKISAGTAISMTTRDSFRVFEGMDFTRLMSYWHSCGGYYISNILIVIAFLSTLFYMASMALTGLDLAILASNSVYLLSNDINALQFFVQLGLLSVIPLFVLFFVEYGFLSSLWKTLSMFGGLSPLFFMLEIQTKAWFFDQALAFGKSSYLATGRDFVIRHLEFSENYRATASSHIYLGMEALTLLALTSAFGSWASPVQYIFFFLTAWLFTCSLLFGQFWFNPFQLEWKSIKADMKSWWRWMEAQEGSPENSWLVWFERETGGQYAQANLATRCWRTVRISRILVLVALLVFRAPNASFLHLALMLGLSFAAILAFQVVHCFFLPCAAQGGAVAAVTSGVSIGALPLSKRAYKVRGFVILGLYCCFVGGAVIVGSMAGGGIESLALAIIAFHASLFWASRVLNIASFWLLSDGIRATHKAFDFLIGGFLLGVQGFCALFFPGGSVLHTHLLFSRRYADTVEVVSGTKELLDRHSKGAAAKFLKLKHLGELQHKGAAAIGDVNTAAGAAVAESAATSRSSGGQNSSATAGAGSGLNSQGDPLPPLPTSNAPVAVPLAPKGSRPRNRWGLPKKAHTDTDRLKEEFGVTSAPENRIGVRRNMPLRPLHQIGNTPKDENEQNGASKDGKNLADHTNAPGVPAVGGTNAAAVAATGGTAFGTINIPGLAAAVGDDHAPPPSSAPAPAAGENPAAGTGAVDGSAPASSAAAAAERQVKSIRDILTEYGTKASKKKQEEEEKKKKKEEEEKGKEGKKSGKDDADGKKKAGGKWPPPKKGGGDDDDDGGGGVGGGGGVAALRARLEKAAAKAAAEKEKEEEQKAKK